MPEDDGTAGNSLLGCGAGSPDFARVASIPDSGFTAGIPDSAGVTGIPASICATRRHSRSSARSRLYKYGERSKHPDLASGTSIPNRSRGTSIPNRFGARGPDSRSFLSYFAITSIHFERFAISKLDPKKENTEISLYYVNDRRRPKKA